MSEPIRPLIPSSTGETLIPVRDALLMTEASEHLTVIRRFDRRWIQAHCPEHGAVGYRQIDSTGGRNAVATEARAHDDVAHGVYRETGGYWNALAVRPWEQTND